MFYFVPADCHILPFVSVADFFKNNILFDIFTSVTNKTRTNSSGYNEMNFFFLLSLLLSVCLWLKKSFIKISPESGSLFDVGRWKFDVRSSFVFRTKLAPSGDFWANKH